MMNLRNLLCVLAAGVASPLAMGATYLGNGRTDFGGPVGDGSLEVTDDGTTLTFTFTRGGGAFNDFLVLYFDTQAGGSTAMNASGEIGSPFAGRRALVNEFGSSISFPAGFDSDYGFALKAAGSSSNHLFGTPSGSDANTVGFVNTYAVSNFGNATASSYSWSIPVADLGLTPNSGQSFEFIVSYLNPEGGEGGDATFRSSEAIGYDPGASAIGFGNYSVPTSLNYTIVPEPTTALLGGLALLGMLRRRKS